MKKIIKRANGTKRVMTINDQPSKTQQQFKDETDVNFIMRKYQKTGEITHLNRKQGVYADLTNIPDYNVALNTVIHAQDTFMTLPSSVRTRFENDPAQLIKFMSNPLNYDEAVNLGLVERKHQIQDQQKQKPNDEKPNSKPKNDDTKNKPNDP